MPLQADPVAPIGHRIRSLGRGLATPGGFNGGQTAQKKKQKRGSHIRAPCPDMMGCLLGNQLVGVWTNLFVCNRVGPASARVHMIAAARLAFHQATCLVRVHQERHVVGTFASGIPPVHCAAASVVGIFWAGLPRMF
eukprot:gene17589-biopygen5349